MKSFPYLLVLMLAGCGTNVKALLDEDNRLAWQADPIVMAAEDLDGNLVQPFNAVESAKIEACEPLYSAAEEQFEQGEWSYAQKLWANVALFVARIFPVASVERCARAHERYGQELAALRQHLEVNGIAVQTDD